MIPERLVERMARAMCEDDCSDWEHVNQRLYLRSARAALASCPELVGLIEAAMAYGTQSDSGRGAKDHVFPLHQAALSFARSNSDTSKVG